MMIFIYLFIYLQLEPMNKKNKNLFTHQVIGHKEFDTMMVAV